MGTYLELSTPLIQTANKYGFSNPKLGVINEKTGETRERLPIGEYTNMPPAMSFETTGKGKKEE